MEAAWGCGEAMELKSGSLLKAFMTYSRSRSGRSICDDRFSLNGGWRRSQVLVISRLRTDLPAPVVGSLVRARECAAIGGIFKHKNF